MKSFVLEPTPENILETFMTDLLGRRQDIAYFVSLLNLLEQGTSIALDARWGAGKTFFVKQTKLVLDVFNEHTTICNEEEGKQIKDAWSKLKGCPKPELQPQVTVYYDAWANDNDEDPLLSLIYTILQNVSIDYSFKESPAFFTLAAGIAEVFSGIGFSSILQTLKQEDPLSTLRAKKDLYAEINNFLSSLLAERGNRLVIFIDELDRCKPSFAVQLLERIKHYFCNEQVTFVFSVNLSELQHSVKQIYGAEFDACRYLDRFFDYRLDLPPADMSRFYHTIELNDGSWTYDSVCRAVIEVNKFSLRETARFWAQARAAAYKPTHERSDQFLFGDGRARQFALYCVLPIMLGLKIADQTRYTQFIEGKDSGPLHDVMAANEGTPHLLSQLLSTNEVFTSSGSQPQTKEVSIHDKLEQLYDALFVRKYVAPIYEVEIGSCSFSSETRDFLLRAASTFSRYADYTL